MNGNPPLREEYRQAAALMEKLDRLGHAWMRMYPPPPVRKGDMRLLGVLMERERDHLPPPTTGSLAQRMKQSVPGISQRVAVLQREGYVRRVPGDSDRRVVMIELTQAGREAGRRAMEHMLRNLQKTLQALGEEKTEAFLALVDDFGDVLVQMGQSENTKQGGQHT